MKPTPFPPSSSNLLLFHEAVFEKFINLQT